MPEALSKWTDRHMYRQCDYNMSAFRCRWFKTPFHWQLFAWLCLLNQYWCLVTFTREHTSRQHDVFKKDKYLIMFYLEYLVFVITDLEHHSNPLLSNTLRQVKLSIPCHCRGLAVYIFHAKHCKSWNGFLFNEQYRDWDSHNPTVLLDIHHFARYLLSTYNL